MIKWTKPNGTKIETNDAPATIAEATRLGWKRVAKKTTKKKAAKK